MALFKLVCWAIIFLTKPLRMFSSKKTQKDRQTCDEKSKCDDKTNDNDIEVSKSTAQFLLELVMNGCVAATFPNAMIALRLFLTLPCGVASGERSFSALKRIKSPFRSTMSQERTVSLCLMAANVDVLRKLDVNEVSKKFSVLKCWRKLVSKWNTCM